jgi:hypothetical protein
MEKSTHGHTYTRIQVGKPLVYLRTCLLLYLPAEHL